ncbi:hypothetical protein XANCAGTX0491_003410 [Xanthoria calcicola]
MTPQRARKLKETCDSCSASKVKCEKQWPRCGRCDNLGYPCFYSPAMRKGRPHPTINGNGQKKSTVEAAKPAKQQKSTTDPDPPFSRPPSQNDGEQDHASKTKGALAAQQNHHRQSSMPIFPPNMSAHQVPPTASIPRLEAPSPSTTSTDTSSDIFSPSSTNASSVTSHDDDIHTWLPKPPPPNPQSSHPHCSSDCASIAIQSLQDLTSTSSSPMEPTATHLLNHQLHTTTTSIKHLSAILICPCSRNPDIGLLNAALVAAILDSYSTILCNAVPPSPLPHLSSSEITHMMTGHNDSVAINPMAVLTPHNNSNSTNTPYSNAGPRQRHQQQQQTTIQRVLDELPKAANVVMQFSRRYSALTDECVPTQQQQQQQQQFGKEDIVGLIPTVAMEQRVRLKEIVDQATGMMALVA